MTARDLSGRLVLVTGGVRGIGRAISMAFAARGAHVIVNYFHSYREAPAFLAELEAAGGSAEILRASVADRDQVEMMFDAIAERHGGLDILINNAGAGGMGGIDEVDDRYWERAWSTNLRGSLWCSQRAAALMDSRGGGAIVNLSSVGGGSLVMNAYSACGAAKAAVEALTRYQAAEYAPRRIRANTVTCGVLESESVRRFPDAARFVSRVRDATPLEHRLGREEELAEVVAFLASPAASWVTGQNIVVDGGLSLGAMLLSPAPERGEAVAASPPQEVPVGVPSQDHPVATTDMTTALPNAGIGPDADALVAVVGMGVVTPGANDPDELWQVLNGDEHMFGEPTRFDVASFHSEAAEAVDRSYTRESGFITDFRPCDRLREELESGLLPSEEASTLWLRHGLYTALQGVARRGSDRYFVAFGFTADGSQELEEHLVLAGYRNAVAEASDEISPEVYRRLHDRYDQRGTPPGECFPHRIGRNAIAGLLPDTTEMVMVDTACSSSLYSIDLGVKALREGSCDIAVCGGAFAYSARNVVLFAKLSGLSRNGQVRSFDRDASGVLFSDGSGVLILKRLDRARADGDTVLGVIHGIGLACDGRGKAIYAPNQAGQELALRRAYADGLSDPSQISWVIAHATGTQAGDSTEVAALNAAAGTGPTALLSSNKAILGHTGWAAGTVSVVQGLAGLQRGTAPAQRYLRRPISALESSRFSPPTSSIDLPGHRPRRIGVNAFGFGGTDAHLILGEDDPQGPTRAQRAAISTDEIVVAGWATDVPGNEQAIAWLKGQGTPPDLSFGDDYPLPGFAEVPLPPPTLRNMDRTQTMVLRAASRLPEPVLQACASHRDTVGVVVGHMGPTRRGVHYALRCYLGDLERCLTGSDTPSAEIVSILKQVTEKVHALVPASTEDSFPGIMPNIISARLAALSDYRGLSTTLDTGPDSSLDALRTAERHLRHHTLDLAIVAGVNGNSTAELAELIDSGQDRDALAEGAFLLVLTRASTAHRLGLPVLARLRTETGWAEQGTRAGDQPPLAGSGRTYLGADPMAALLARLTGPPGSATISCAADWGTKIRVTVPETGAGPEEETAEHRGEPATVRRTVCELRPAPVQTVRPTLAALPEGTLVLTGTGLPDLDLPRDVALVTAPLGSGSPGTDPAALAALLPEGPITHVRVIADLRATSTQPSDLHAVDQMRVLHDLAFLAAQRWSVESGSSFAVLLLDAVRDRVRHPATGLFTGLVKSLTREAPDALAFAVLTDNGDLNSGLRLLAAESGTVQQLAVSVHMAGVRHAYQLRAAAPADAPTHAIGPDSVIVSAGGSRGIAAALLEGLAAKAKPTIYILGRTPPADTSAVGTRAQYMSDERRRRPQVTAAELAAEYDRLSASVQVRRTIDRLTSLCGQGRVHYMICDVTDPAAVMAAIDRVYESDTRVDLVINAAGTHHGGTVRTTSLPQMRRVRDTKLLGYLNIRQAFTGRSAGRCYHIGSLLAVIGWPGEAGYCSGNDLLGAAAGWARRFGDSAETTLAMPLWDETGFAAEPVTRDLLRRQGALTAISTMEGVRLFLTELASAGPAEITYLGAAERELLFPEALRKRSLLHDGEMPSQYRYAPEPDNGDGYLRHHRLQDRPVVPAALITELALQAVRGQGSDGRPPLIVRDLLFHAPVEGEQVPRSGYRVDVQGNRVLVLSDVRAPDGRMLRPNRLHAEAVVPPAVSGPPPSAPQAPTSPLGRRVTPPWYRDGGLLSLDGPFRSLKDLVAGPVTTARFGPDPGPWGDALAALRTPMLLLDSLVQLVTVAQWVRSGTTDSTLLPVGIDEVTFHTSRNDVELLGEYGDTVVIFTDENGGQATAIAPDGTPLLHISGVRLSRT